MSFPFRESEGTGDPEPETLNLGSFLRLTCQRCLRPADGIYHSPPRSLGCLPFGKHDSTVLVPVANNEAFWLGISALGPACRLRVTVQTVAHGQLNARSGRPTQEDDSSHFVITRFTAVQGVYRPEGGWWPFQRLQQNDSPACHELYLAATVQDASQNNLSTVRTTVCLVDYPEFARLTGLPQPKPLDPSSGYEGWLLP
jgi:hypothetical protein